MNLFMSSLPSHLGLFKPTYMDMHTYAITWITIQHCCQQKLQLAHGNDHLALRDLGQRKKEVSVVLQFYITG